jgi:hypothetical protein
VYLQQQGITLDQKLAIGGGMLAGLVAAAISSPIDSYKSIRLNSDQKKLPEFKQYSIIRSVKMLYRGFGFYAGRVMVFNGVLFGLLYRFGY